MHTRRAFISVLAAATALLAGCGGSGNGPASQPKTSASANPTASGAGTDALAGTWHFTLTGPHLTFGFGSYKGASVSGSGNRITVTGRESARSQFTANDPSGEVTIRCAAQLCHAGLLAFKPVPGGYQLVNTGTLEPYEVESGAAVCGAPAAPDAYRIRDFTSSGFSFVAGWTQKNGDDCYQVLWTIKATKVS